MGNNPMGLPLVLTVGSACNSYFKWSLIPSSVPVWWNLDASPLLWAPRWLGVITLPILGFFIPYIMYLAISRDSHVDKQAGESKHAVAQVINMPALFLSSIQNFVLLEFAFISVDHYFAPRFFVANIALWLLIWLGYNVQYIEPNHSIGIVTPWTYNKSGVWEKTHTHAGYVLQIAGLVLFICAIFLPRGLVLLLITLFLWLGSYIYIFVYSWAISGAPDREPLIPK